MISKGSRTYDHRLRIDNLLNCPYSLFLQNHRRFEDGWLRGISMILNGESPHENGKQISHVLLQKKHKGFDTPHLDIKLSSTFVLIKTS